MLKWSIRIAVTVVDIVLLICLWQVAGWQNPLELLSCDDDGALGPTAMASSGTVDTAEAPAIIQMSGAMDDDMSGD